MMAMEMFAELLDTATNEAHKPVSGQIISVFKNNTINILNNMKC
jgi:hypothetical protein